MYNNDPKYMNPPEAGLASLLASRGRNGDSMLVHMAPEEVQGLQKLAVAYGSQPVYNPDTGLPEFSFLKKLLPTIIGAILPGIPGLGKFAETIGFGSQALGTAFLVGGATSLIEGDLKKGLMAGLGAYSGANLAQSLQQASMVEAPAVSADEIAKTSRAIDAAKATVGAGPVDSTKVMGSLPDFQAGVVPTVTPPPSAPIVAPPSPDGLDFFKSANAFKGTPTAQDLIAGRVANAANTGIAGILRGGQSLFTSPKSREVFGEALGGGFQSPFAQSLSKQATFMGIANALTPEYEMPSGGAEEEGASVYIPGAVNPMYGYGGQYSYFMPGQYYKRTKNGLVPYNPYAMAPGYATGGPVQAPDQDMNRQRAIPHQNPQFPYPNQNYPLSTVTQGNYSSSSPQPREILGGYEVKIDPYTGQERFANGGPVTDDDPTNYPPIGVAPPPVNPYAQPAAQGTNRPPPPSATTPLPPEPPVGPPPIILPPDSPFDPARQRYLNMVNAPPKPPVDTKAVMDYVAELNRRAKTPEFIAFPPGGIVTPPSTGGGGGTGGDKGDKGDKNEPGGGRGGTGTGTGGSGSGGGTGTGGTGGGIGGGVGTGGTGSKPGGGTGNKPGSGGPPGTGEDEGDADPNQDDPDADKKDDDGLLDRAKDRFMEWFNKRFRDPYGLIGTAIGFTGAGALGTWAWDKLTPQIQKFFTSTQELTPEQQAEVERIIEEKAKQEKEAKEKREGIVSRGEGRGGAGIGGGFGGAGGGGFGGGGGGRRGKITIEEMPQPARAGGHVRAMQAGGMTMPPPNNPYGAAVGEDYNFGFSGGGEMPTEYLAGGKLLEGEGDGMSDDIPAVIRGKGVQRAALADGEFVVPADVVSHLGNGSTKAGAKKLYAMMDRIREARTGRTRQSPAVNANKYLPA